MNRLAEFPQICLKHFTSRFLCPWNPYTHDYLDTYMELLANRPIRRILEIGLGPAGLFHPQQLAGCGLRMWAETFPEADIFGLDYDASTLVNEGRIKSFLCDEKVEAQLKFVSKLIGPELDFIVDDGSHEASDQIRAAQIFIPLLSATGVYVIEDVLYKDAVIARIGYKHRIVEKRIDVLPDDRLLIIEARDR